jgi:hypothetical protein
VQVNSRIEADVTINDAFPELIRDLKSVLGALNNIVTEHPESGYYASARDRAAVAISKVEKIYADIIAHESR